MSVISDFPRSGADSIISKTFSTSHLLLVKSDLKALRMGHAEGSCSFLEGINSTGELHDSPATPQRWPISGVIASSQRPTLRLSLCLLAFSPRSSLRQQVLAYPDSSTALKSEALSQIFYLFFNVKKSFLVKC